MNKYYVYRFKNSKNEIVYVGKSVNFINRMKQHFNGGGHLSKECYDDVRKIEYIELNHPIDMTIYELYYISKYRPKYNSNDILEDIESDIANITENVKWIESDFFENNKVVYGDISTLNLDNFIDKYIHEGNSKNLHDYLGDKGASLKDFYHILESYGIVGKVDGMMRFYTEGAINNFFKEHNIKYRLKFDIKRFDYKGSRSCRIRELYTI